LATTTQQEQQALGEIAPAAVALEKSNDSSARFTVAQCALETRVSAAHVVRQSPSSANEERETQ